VPANWVAGNLVMVAEHFSSFQSTSTLAPTIAIVPGSSKPASWFQPQEGVNKVEYM
jgi:hypothetical protein